MLSYLDPTLGCPMLGLGVGMCVNLEEYVCYEVSLCMNLEGYVSYEVTLYMTPKSFTTLITTVLSLLLQLMPIQADFM